MAPSTQPLSSYAGGLDHLLAVVNVAVMAIDGRGRPTLLNDEAARLLRVQPPPPSEIAHALRAVSWLAHEVKNPLATIQLYTELIGRTLPPDDRQLVTTIKEQVNLAQTRISELLRSLSPRVEDSHPPP